jgi:hypothetical protein
MPLWRNTENIAEFSLLLLQDKLCYSAGNIIQNSLYFASCQGFELFEQVLTISVRLPVILNLECCRVFALCQPNSKKTMLQEVH